MLLCTIYQADQLLCSRLNELHLYHPAEDPFIPPLNQFSYCSVDVCSLTFLLERREKYLKGYIPSVFIACIKGYLNLHLKPPGTTLL